MTPEEMKAFEKDFADLKTGFTSSEDFKKFETKFDEAVKSNGELSKAQDEAIKTIRDDLAKHEAFVKSSVGKGGDVSESLNIDFGDFVKDVSKQSILEFLAVDDGRHSEMINKAITSHVNTPGAAISTMTPLLTLQAQNPFRRLARIIPAPIGQKVNIPRISGIGWKAENAQPTAQRADGSVLSSTSLTVEPYTLEVRLSIFAEGALAGLDASIVEDMVATAPLAEVNSTLAMLKTRVAGAGKMINTTLTTDVANGLPTAATVIDKMSDVIASLPSQYRIGASFLVSDAMASQLRKSKNDNLNFNPLIQAQTLFGYPIESLSTMDGMANGDIVAMFGNFRTGLIAVSKPTISISRYYETNPGSITYFGTMGYSSDVADGSAISALLAGPKA